MRLLLAARLLLPLAAVSAQASFRSRDALRDAVNLWCSNSTTARQIYGAIGRWDVSKVTNMNLLFNDKFTFNEDISRWDVSRVVSMNHMFDNAQAFDVDISSWDVSHVEEMYAMFNGAKVFDQDLARWDISRVRHGSAPMRHMFRDALALSECHKHRINTAWSPRNSKWQYTSLWSDATCPPPSPPA